MSIQDTRKSLLTALKENNNRVVALFGKWGTGKSHMWRDAREEYEKDTGKKTIYASVFGAQDIRSLKMKLLQLAVAEDTNARKEIEKYLPYAAGALKAASLFLPSLTLASDFALLALPHALKKKLIVLDDLERKHDSLSISEILGLIDEITQRAECKVLIIMNRAKLSDLGDWRELREKVVDAEIELRTTPEEAVEIAIKRLPSTHNVEIAHAISTCRINNIRVTQRIISTINRILANINKPSQQLLARVVPSTTLLTAIYLDGMEDPPTIEFVLRAGLPEKTGTQSDPRSDLGEDSQKSPGTENWHQLLLNLGIFGCDEYETLLIDFLETGMLDESRLSTVVQNYASEEQKLVASNSCRLLRAEIYWNWRKTDADLLRDAEELSKLASQLSIGDCSSLIEALSEIPNSQPICDRFLDAAASNIRDTSPEVDIEVPFFNPLHPILQEAISERERRIHDQTELRHALDAIVERGVYGLRHTRALNRMTADDFRREIEEATIEDLK